MGVEPKIGGKPPKWMVKIMENPIKMDDLGIPLFLETPRYVRISLRILWPGDGDVSTINRSGGVWILRVI